GGLCKVQCLTFISMRVFGRACPSCFLVLLVDEVNKLSSKGNKSESSSSIFEKNMMSLSLNGIEIKVMVDDISNHERVERVFISTPPCDEAGSYCSLSIDCVASNSIILKVNKTAAF
ncbi:hypothetical protein, partial [Aeromonas sp. HMWF016]|uniref:hypothetical protein n=1 Tax=Aeromonas sp. HMWF016 TaxID=2056852 RepID=UPI001C63093F